MKLKHIPALLAGKRIIEMTYYVTDVCNFACKHCFVIDELNKNVDRLTVEELHKLGASIGPLQRVSIAGGEPFMRKHITDVLLIISEAWDANIITVPTNGYYGKKIRETIETFGERGKNQLRIMFSLNTPIEEDYLSFINVNKKDAFRKWRENLEEVRDVARQYSNISLGVLTSYNIYNQNIFEELLDFVCNELQIEDFSFHLVRGGEKDGELNLQQFKSIIQQYYEEKDEGGAVLSSYRELLREYMVSYYEQPRMLATCASGKVRITIAPNGDVYPCETLGYPAKTRDSWLIGNVRDFNYDIEALMKSARSRSLHNQIVRDKCHCQDGCDMSVSLMMNNKFRAKVALRAAGKLLRG